MKGGRGKPKTERKCHSGGGGLRDRIVGFQSEGRGQGRQVALWELGKARNQILLWGHQEECGSVSTWILAQRDQSQTFDSQNCKIMNLYYFRPLNFGSLVTVEIGD